MNLPSLLTLKSTEEGQQQIRVMVAELDGWNLDPSAAHNWKSRGQWALHAEADRLVSNHSIPPYTTSLDAVMPLVRKSFSTKEHQANYSQRLIEVLNEVHRGEFRFCGASPFDIATAEPLDICIALLTALKP